MTPSPISTLGRSVVVGVDGSPQATDAALLGQRLAEAAEGSLHLVTGAAQTVVAAVATRAGVDADRLEEALLRVAVDRATEGLRSEPATAELADTLIARPGEPEHVLAETGRELAADLFVLGGHRRSKVAWLRRGTAERLLRFCEAPVLVTGPEGARLDRVVAAVDRSFAAGPTIAAAASVAELLGCPLEVVHVTPEPLIPPSLGLDLDAEELMRSEEAAARAEFQRLLPDGAVTVRRGEVLPSLLDAVEGRAGTLLAVGAQGRGWVHRMIVGSTTRALLAELPTSLLVVPTSPPSSTHGG